MGEIQAPPGWGSSGRASPSRSCPIPANFPSLRQWGILIVTGEEE